MRVPGVTFLAVTLMIGGCGLLQKPNFDRGPAASRKPAPTRHLKAPKTTTVADPPAPAKTAAVKSAPSPAPALAPAAHAEPLPLGIPADEIPPVGACRVWLPGAVLEQQSASGPCDVVQQKVPAGAWVLHRSRDRSNEVAVNVYRSRWPYLISETRYFDYWTGRLLRVE